MTLSLSILFVLGFRFLVDLNRVAADPEEGEDGEIHSITVLNDTDSDILNCKC